eukprot:6176620-Pleurochrysis_carterae.AAC.7
MSCSRQEQALHESAAYALQKATTTDQATEMQVACTQRLQAGCCGASPQREREGEGEGRKARVRAREGGGKWEKGGGRGERREKEGGERKRARLVVW